MDWTDRLRDAVAQAGVGALATGRSAAQLWGIRVGPAVIEVWTPAKQRLPGVTAATRSGIPVIDAPTTLLLLASVRSVEDVVSSAEAMGVPGDLLTQRASDWLAARGPNPREVRALLEHLEGAARPDSVLETRFLQVLERAALRKHAVLHHVIEIGLPPRRIELDFAFPETKVAVELDGWTYHRTRSSFRSDRNRDVHLNGLGWVVLRFTYTDVERRPSGVVDQLRRTLRARS